MVVQYLDFVLDGVVLGNLAAAEGVDIPQVGWIQDDQPAAAVACIERLLGVAPGDVFDGRVSLLVCPCWNLDCGAVTASLVIDEDRVTWADLGFQWCMSDEIEPIPEGGARSFCFDRSQYEEVLGHELERQRGLALGRD
jgi:hypothetical protein